VSGRRLDPVLTELVRHELGALVDDMMLALMRSARSQVVRITMDFSTALCDARGRMIAQGTSLPLHLGAIPDAMQAMLRHFGNRIGRGDILAMNDPYAGGMHLPDLFMFRPIFNDDTLLAFAAIVMHLPDIGGRIPGGVATDSQDLFQEGLQIPPLKLFEADVPNDSLFELIEANVRVPDLVMGDIAAQIAACHFAERGYLEIVRRHGVEKLTAHQAQLLDAAEAIARRAIAAMPDGTYTFEDHIDGDGIDPDPIPIRAAVTITGDEIVVDFTGTARQVKGAINATYSFTKSAAYFVVRSIIEEELPDNEGYFRPIRVIAPEGTIVNPIYPGACGARGLTGFRVIDTLFGAFAQVAPTRVRAAGEGGVTVISLGGNWPDGRPFIYLDILQGAWGGRDGADGEEGVTNPAGNMTNTPAELAEIQAPIRIETYEFVPDSGGAGQFRGGLALRRDIHFLASDVTVQIRSDRRRFPPYGLAGGSAGMPSGIWLVRDGSSELLEPKVTFTAQAGDMLRVEIPGAGGYGPPHHRDPASVVEDVLDGKVTALQAERDYEVRIGSSGTEIGSGSTAYASGRDTPKVGT
jgi:N-methylhydantoinase B